MEIRKEGQLNRGAIRLKVEPDKQLEFETWLKLFELDDEKEWEEFGFSEESFESGNVEAGKQANCKTKPRGNRSNQTRFRLLGVQVFRDLLSTRVLQKYGRSSGMLTQCHEF